MKRRNCRPIGRGKADRDPVSPRVGESFAAESSLDPIVERAGSSKIIGADCDVSE
jgi:hypothetical protein